MSWELRLLVWFMCYLVPDCIETWQKTNGFKWLFPFTNPIHVKYATTHFGTIYPTIIINKCFVILVRQAHYFRWNDLSMTEWVPTQWVLPVFLNCSLCYQSNTDTWVTLGKSLCKKYRWRSTVQKGTHGVKLSNTKTMLNIPTNHWGPLGYKDTLEYKPRDISAYLTNPKSIVFF